MLTILRVGTRLVSTVARRRNIVEKTVWSLSRLFNVVRVRVKQMVSPHGAYVIEAKPAIIPAS